MSNLVINSGEDWTFEDICQISDEVEKIGKEMGYSWYPNQIEIITSEQMLDCYSSVGLPNMYNHWSFGKRFLRDHEAYSKGRQGLAYEIVINSDPCIVYCMEDNDKMMQALVIAHAGIGHNHFFRNNQLFRQWTDASSILDYMEYAKSFVSACEEKFGIPAVEKILNAAHAIQHQGVFRYPRKQPLSLKREREREIFRALEEESNYNDVMETTLPPDYSVTKWKDPEYLARKKSLKLPEENILYFLEMHSPVLKQWQRELLRIVRNIAQYFYPQIQDKIMNEGCATWTHYQILYKMYERGMMTPGAMKAFLKSHTSVVYQPDFDSPYYSGINPYALGFAMMQDIVRICDEPTAEDKEWFPLIAGKGNHMDVLFEAWETHRDESFIRQFLSPKVMRDFKLFSIGNLNSKEYKVCNIHNDSGYKAIRSTLADSNDITNIIPEINIVDVDLHGNRDLELKFIRPLGGMDLKNTGPVIQYIADLWGYGVRLSHRCDISNHTYDSNYRTPSIPDDADVSKFS